MFRVHKIVNTQKLIAFSHKKSSNQKLKFLGKKRKNLYNAYGWSNRRSETLVHKYKILLREIKGLNNYRDICVYGIENTI